MPQKLIMNKNNKPVINDSNLDYTKKNPTKINVVLDKSSRMDI